MCNPKTHGGYFALMKGERKLKLFQYVVNGVLVAVYATKQSTVEQYLREKYGKCASIAMLQELDVEGEEDEID